MADIVEFDIPEHEAYKGSYESENRLPARPEQDWTSSDINLLRTVLASFYARLGQVGDVDDLTGEYESLVEAINGILSGSTGDIGATLTELENKADSALQDAANAQSTADGADTKASTAISDAAAAQSDADDAQVDATQALSDAADAQTDATQALADASTADGKAVAAQSDATQALSDAADAQTDATAALTAIGDLTDPIYGSIATASLTINAALVDGRELFKQLVDTTSGELTVTIAGDLATGQELIINRLAGDNNLLIDAGEDIDFYGEDADPLVLNYRGWVHLKKTATGWITVDHRATDSAAA